MLEMYREELIRVTRELSEKELKKYHVNNLINLSSMLPEQDQDISEMMLELKQMISEVHEATFNKKIVAKLYTKLTTAVKERFDFHEKGSVTAYYTSMGMVFGVAIGTALSSMITGNLPIGIGVGLAIGAGIGSMKEKALAADNKLF